MPNKTALGLNQWVANDKPKMAEFNEDNLKIDSALTELSQILSGVAADSARLSDTKADKTQLSNRNLLHNWDFRNPVNQRGKASYNASGYTIDRWRTNSNNFTVTVASGYVAVTNNDIADKIYIQLMERMVPGNYTMSVMLADGSVLSASTYINASVASGSTGGQTMTLTDGLKVLIGDFGAPSYPAFKIVVGVGKTFNLAAAKLELGSVSTLANDPPADYGVELAKCQRYFRLLDPYIAGIGYSGVDRGNVDVLIPNTLRIAPTLVTLSGTNTPQVRGNGTAPINVTIGSVFASGGGVTIRLLANEILANTVYAFRPNGNQYALDANL